MDTRGQHDSVGRTWRFCWAFEALSCGFRELAGGGGFHRMILYVEQKCATVLIQKQNRQATKESSAAGAAGLGHEEDTSAGLRPAHLSYTKRRRYRLSPPVMAGLDPYRIHTTLAMFQPSNMVLRRKKPCKVTTGPGLP